MADGKKRNENGLVGLTYCFWHEAEASSSSDDRYRRPEACVGQCEMKNGKKRRETWSIPLSMMAMAMNENDQQRFVEKMCGAICAPILDPRRMVFLPV
jgi:hypothetical protein